MKSEHISKTPRSAAFALLSVSHGVKDAVMWQRLHYTQLCDKSYNINYEIHTSTRKWPFSLPYLRERQHFLPSYSKKQTKPKYIIWVFFLPPSTLSQDSLSDQPTNCIFSSYTSVYFYCCHSRKLPSFFLIALIALKLDVLLTFLFPCLHAFSSEQPVTFVKYKLGSAYHTSITLKVEWNWNPLLFRLLPYPSS